MPGFWGRMRLAFGHATRPPSGTLAIAACTAPVPVAEPSLAPIVLGQRAIRPVPAFGAVWIALAAEGTVQRIDPTTGTIAATITVADPQRLLAAGAGALWAVANDADAIVRIDPGRN